MFKASFIHFAYQLILTIFSLRHQGISWHAHYIHTHIHIHKYAHRLIDIWQLTDVHNIQYSIYSYV